MRIGVIGGGQLARMMALAASPLGIRVHALDPDRVQIGNNLGKVNGWVAWRDVLGRCVDA